MASESPALMVSLESSTLVVAPESSALMVCFDGLLRNH